MRLSFALAGLALCFSFWMMYHTFHYDAGSGSVLVSSLVWSDFLSHIPLIRSFSLGENWPPEYPIFPGEPIRYHFVYYAVVGWIERLGFRLDWALNLPSALSFFFLLVLIYQFATYLFRDRRVGIMASLFFLFNGSLSFLSFFKKNPLSMKSFSEIWAHKWYAAYAPWDGSGISAFWTLNVYINQRHLAFALGFILLTHWIYSVAGRWPNRKQIFMGVFFGAVAGLFPFYHQPGLLMVAILMACNLLILPSAWRWALAFGTTATVLIAFQIPMLLRNSGPQNILFFPGYLAHDGLTLSTFITFWIKNLGVHFVLIPLGLFLAPKKVRSAFIPMAIIFVMANLFRFGKEASTNHKFFNYFIIMGNMASAYCLVKIFDFSKNFLQKTRNPFPAITGAVLPLCLGFVCVFSGLLDFMVLKNSAYHTFYDLPKNDVANWILHNTPPRSVFLSSNYGLNAPSLAGRPILMAWPYFAWSLGYDLEKRKAQAKTIFEGNDPITFCPILKELNASYVMVEDSKDINFPPINSKYFLQNFTADYTSKDEKMWVFSSKRLCANLVNQ